MNTQLSLEDFKEAHRLIHSGALTHHIPCQFHSSTSRAAAVAIKESAETLRAKVLEYLQMMGESGSTDEQAQEDLNMPGSTQRPRRVELVKAGLVIDSGRERKTRSGRLAVVWVAK